MRHLSQRGFSLIELMIVVVIIGILALIAVPSYKDYTLRARFAEVATTTIPFKTAVALAIQKGEPIEQLNNGNHGIPTSPEPTKNLASLIVKNGVITATATPAAGNVTLILTPNHEGNHWTVAGTCVAKGLCDQ